MQATERKDTGSEPVEIKLPSGTLERSFRKLRYSAISSYTLTCQCGVKHSFEEVASIEPKEGIIEK